MSDVSKLAVFNPRPDIEAVRLADGNLCLVIDNALLAPERLVDWAAAHAGDFRPVDFNAYPGHYLMTPDPVVQSLQTFFLQHLRALFDARRLLRLHCRLAMVTLPPRALQPFQQVCHSDNFRLEPSLSIQASVLYLFRDESLGGTSFYRPARSAEETGRLFADANTLSREAFAERYGFGPGYLTGSNAWFTCTGTVPPRFNRMIVYDGGVLHTGDIGSPEKLRTDPRRGRLTFNGFFTCRRHTR